MRVQVQRVVVHGEQAEQVVVVLGDRLAGPVLVRRADLELLVAASELHAHTLPARARTRTMAYLTSASRPAPAGLATVHLRRAADHLRAVRLLARRAVLVDALLPVVLPLQRLAHLGLEVVVRLRVGHTSPSHGSGAA